MLQHIRHWCWYHIKRNHGGIWGELLHVDLPPPMDRSSLSDTRGLSPPLPLQPPLLPLCPSPPPGCSCSPRSEPLEPVQQEPGLAPVGLQAQLPADLTKL